MITSRFAVILLPGFLLLLLALACSTGAMRKDEAVTGPPTLLTVENRGFADMNIFAMRGSFRVRLGRVNGHSSITFTVPEDVVAGGGQLRFVADPIGARGNSITEEMNVSPGDEVNMLILN